MAWPAIIAALGGSLIGAAGNYLSNKAAHEDSLDAQRESNAFNAEQAGINRGFLSAEAEKDRQFQWKSEMNAREFNSPAAQMARLRNAGINPYLAEGISTGEGSSLAGSNVAGGSAASSATPPQRHGLDYSSVIAGGIQSYAQMKQAENQTKLMDSQSELYSKQAIGYDIQNQYAHSKALMELLQNRANIELTMKSGEEKNRLLALYDLQIKKFNATFNDEVEGVKLRNNLVEAQTSAQNAAAELSKHGIKLQESQIAQLSAEIDKIYQDVRESVSRVSLNGVLEKQHIQGTKNMVDQQVNMVFDRILTKTQIQQLLHKFPYVLDDLKSGIIEKLYRGSGFQVGPFDFHFQPNGANDYFDNSYHD